MWIITSRSPGAHSSLKASILSHPGHLFPCIWNKLHKYPNRSTFCICNPGAINLTLCLWREPQMILGLWYGIIPQIQISLRWRWHLLSLYISSAGRWNSRPCWRGRFWLMAFSRPSLSLCLYTDEETSPAQWVELCFPAEPTSGRKVHAP